MNKAFIFDLDGVIINDEQIWEDEKATLYARVFSPEVVAKLGSTLGVNVDTIYDRAVANGSKVDKQTFVSGFFKVASRIYATAPITDGLDELVAYLKTEGYIIGVVSASPLAWITDVTKRLSFENDIALIISLYERPDLAHKPAPDGYLEAMRSLKTTSESTIVLEDSNSGIASAKASGAFTIGLQQNLIKGYKQEGADTYAATVHDVINLLKQRK